MKRLLLAVALCMGRVSSEATNGPYPPSGWRPNGPAFELPQKQTLNPQNAYGAPSQGQEQANPSSEYGIPDDDSGLTVKGLSPRGQTGQFPTNQQPGFGQLTQDNQIQGQFVQAVPVQEPTPLFMVTPVNGQQYVGTTFNADLRLLEEQLRQREAQKQRFNNFEQQQASFGGGQSEPNDYNGFQYQQNPTQTPNTAFGNQGKPLGSNPGFVASSGEGTTTKNQFENPTNPQDTRFGSPVTTSPTRFGYPSQFEPRPTSGFEKGNTPKNNEGTRSRTTFNNNSPTPAGPQPGTDNEEVTDRDQTSQISQQSSSVQVPQQMQIQLPANYPNQLAQLALQQQYPSVPFTQQIGQLQLPIFYQPAPGYSQNLVSQPQYTRIQNFDPNSPANLAAIDMTLAQRQTGYPQQYTTQEQEQYNTNDQENVNQFNPTIQQGQQEFKSTERQGPQQFSSTGQGVPASVQAGQQQGRSSVQLAKPSSVGSQPQQDQGYSTQSPSNNNFRFNTPNGQEQQTQPGQLNRLAFSGNNALSQRDQRNYQAPSQFQLLSGQPSGQVALDRNFPGSSKALLQPYSQQSQLGTRQPGSFSPLISSSEQSPSAFVPQNSFKDQQRSQRPLDRGSPKPGFGQNAQPGFIQSGFDVNQQGNNLDPNNREDEDGQEDDNDESRTPNSFAPGFGDRLPARGFSAYGAPTPQQQYGASAQPRGRGVDDEPPAATDASRTDGEASPTEESPSVAVATAVADARNRKSSKQRARRIRPLFTVDKFGELVQLQ